SIHPGLCQSRDAAVIDEGPASRRTLQQPYTASSIGVHPARQFPPVRHPDEGKSSAAGHLAPPGLHVILGTVLGASVQRELSYLPRDISSRSLAGVSDSARRSISRRCRERNAETMPNEDARSSQNKAIALRGSRG